MRGTNTVNKPIFILGALSALALAGGAHAQQFPIADKLADKVVMKYQTSTCEQLAMQKAMKAQQPPSAMEQRVITALRNDPAMRQEFMNRIAAPVVNKLFECGMIP